MLFPEDEDLDRDGYLDGWDGAPSSYWWDVIVERSPRIWTTGWPLCEGIGHQMFYADDRSEVTQQALELCRQCAVRRECLEWALDNDEKYGVQGGVTALDRAKWRVQGLSPLRMMERADG